ncbi:MAG TPA: hypothetical protein VMZ28_17110 [Kofleriaceae bacterium]|nr:hypothetical protein [Kofleriaceae bacterium]
MKGAETYNLVWLASATGARATTVALWAMSVIADDAHFVFVTWLVGLANALALTEKARSRPGCEPSCVSLRRPTTK